MLGTIPLLKADCDRRGMRSPKRISQTGNSYGGCAFSRGYEHKLLSNPVYAGRIRQSTKASTKRASASRSTKGVQKQLNRGGGKHRTRSNEPLPLLGRLYDSEGKKLTATRAKKGSWRYHYSVGKDLRLPARRNEGDLAHTTRSFLGDQSGLADAVRERDGSLSQLPEAIGQAAALQNESDRELLTHLVRARIGQEEMAVSVDLRASGSEQNEEPTSDPGSEHGNDHQTALTFCTPITFRKRGVEWCMVVEVRDERTANPHGRDEVLVKAIARALRYQTMLASEEDLTVKALSEREDINERYFSKHLPLACLSPKIIRAIPKGTQPADLTADRLLKLPHLPLPWVEQEETLRFA